MNAHVRANATVSIHHRRVGKLMVVRSIRTKLVIVENSYCNKKLRNTTMERRRISLTCSVLWIISTVLPVCGQIGVTICACQPSVYTFTFNFSATCDISTVEGPGVLDADCFARGFAIGSADDVNDTVPVQVTTVSIIELNKDLGVLVQTSYTDVFRDGDNFTYTSILSTPDNITGLTPDMVPGGIQLGIVGVNQMEIPITNVWIILFDNECGIFPVLEVGDQIGWTILVRIDPSHPLLVRSSLLEYATYFAFIVTIVNLVRLEGTTAKCLSIGTTSNTSHNYSN